MLACTMCQVLFQKLCLLTLLSFIKILGEYYYPYSQFTDDQIETEVKQPPKVNHTADVWWHQHLDPGSLTPELLSWLLSSKWILCYVKYVYSSNVRFNSLTYHEWPYFPDKMWDILHDRSFLHIFQVQKTVWKRK